MAAMSLRALPALGVVALTALATAACGSGNDLPVNVGATPSATGAAPAVVVMLRYDSIEPSYVRIHVGQTVEWVFQEAPIPGNVTFADFASATKVSGTFSHTFSSPGTFPYRDTLREEATGVVDVLP